MNGTRTGEQPAHSLAYRNNRVEILAGALPAKYARIIPFIRGGKVLELGSAEGVLCLALARGRHVKTAIALELREERHREALALRQVWADMGHDVAGVSMVQGDIRYNLQLFNGVDTFVAVRSIYYLREDIARVMQAAAAAGVMDVVLCGNANRAAQAMIEPDTDLGRFNRPASVKGMTEILEAAGYRACVMLADGDPIVMGTRA